LLLLATAAAPADGCFSYRRLLLLLTAAAPMAVAPAGDCFSYIHVSVSDLNIPTIGLPILLQENRWTDRGNINVDRSRL
jgi:hypothetical protein